jgi:hypothetical protein
MAEKRYFRATAHDKSGCRAVLFSAVLLPAFHQIAAESGFSYINEFCVETEIGARKFFEKIDFINRFLFFAAAGKQYGTKEQRYRD